MFVFGNTNLSSVADIYVKWDRWKRFDDIAKSPVYTKKVSCAERCFFCRVPKEMTWTMVASSFDYLLFLTTLIVHSYLAYTFLSPMLQEAGYVYRKIIETQN
jgi:hypothetical protein